MKTVLIISVLLLIIAFIVIIFVFKYKGYKRYMNFKNKFIKELNGYKQKQLIIKHLDDIALFKKEWCDELFHFVDKDLLRSALIQGADDYSDKTYYQYAFFPFMEKTGIEYTSDLYNTLDNIEACREEFNKYIKPFLMNDEDYIMDEDFFIQFIDYLSDAEKIEFCMKHKNLANYTYNKIKKKKYKQQLDFIIKVKEE